MIEILSPFFVFIKSFAYICVMKNLILKIIGLFQTDLTNKIINDLINGNPSVVYAKEKYPIYPYPIKSEYHMSYVNNSYNLNVGYKHSFFGGLTLLIDGQEIPSHKVNSWLVYQTLKHLYQKQKIQNIEDKVLNS